MILAGDPADDLGKDLPRVLFALWMTGQMGEYSTQPFEDWIAEALAVKNVRRFADATARGHTLKVIASDISGGQMLVLPDSLAFPPYNSDKGVPSGVPDQFEIGRAVRLSMSIPFFFEPGTLADNVVVDGGITSNFPLWIYDVPAHEAPPHPTFGFRLVGEEKPPKVRHAIDVLGGMINTMRFAHDRYFLQSKDLGRVINIRLAEIGDVTATKFDLTDVDKDALYAAGYESTKRFFLDDWNWIRHLAVRGYDPDGHPASASVSVAVSQSPKTGKSGDPMPMQE